MPDDQRRSDPYRPPATPGPLDYRGPGTPRAGSQWWTDDRPGGSCVIIILLALSGVGAVIAAAVWVLSLMAGC